MSHPFISIITINYNNKDGLLQTIQSVASQTFNDYEHIIIDGASTDGSVDIIENYLHNKAYAPHVSYWCSEKDTGVYNAMNKGIAKAKGEYCLFLNSGDYFIDSKKLSDVCDLHFTEDIVYFAALCHFKNEKKTMHYPAMLTPSFFYGKRTLNHQNVLIKASVQKNRLYNEKYKIVADMDFFFDTIIMKKCSTRYFDFPIVFYDGVDGISSKPENLALRDIEMRNVVSSYLSDAFVADLDYIYALEEQLKEYTNRWGGVLCTLKNVLEKYSQIKTKLKRK